MIRDADFEVAPGEAGERLDRFVLRRAPAARRARVLEALAAGLIRRNGARAAKGTRLAAGDRVGIESLAEMVDETVRPDGDLPLVVRFASDTLLALDKPGGMPVHPLRPDETGTLANALVARYPAQQGLGDHPLMAGLLHRLDAGTSGVVLAARTPVAFASVRRQFRERRVRKSYLALVEGSSPGAARLEDDLFHDPAFRGRMRRVAERPAPAGERIFHAVLTCKVLASSASAALLRVGMETGATHQVRCQLAGAGCPIVGDGLYGTPGDRERHPRDRHFLHAERIVLDDPGGSGELIVRAPPPSDFLACAAKRGLSVEAL